MPSFRLPLSCRVASFSCRARDGADNNLQHFQDSKTQLLPLCVFYFKTHINPIVPHSSFFCFSRKFFHFAFFISKKTVGFHSYFLENSENVQHFSNKFNKLGKFSGIFKNSQTISIFFRFFGIILEKLIKFKII